MNKLLKQLMWQKLIGWGFKLKEYPGYIQSTKVCTFESLGAPNRGGMTAWWQGRQWKLLQYGPLAWMTYYCSFALFAGVKF